MNEYEMVGALKALFEGDVDFDSWCDEVGVDEVRDYAQAGLMTAHAGLVVRLDSGVEFQIRVVQSAGAWA